MAYRFSKGITGCLLTAGVFAFTCMTTEPLQAQVVQRPLSNFLNAQGTGFPDAVNNRTCWTDPVPTDDEVGSPNHQVYPPCSKPYGMTYGEWSAKWWQWVYSIPLEKNPQGIPPFNPPVVDCSQGQSGPVWFLGGDWGGTAVRECKDPVPSDVSIFFPVVNTGFGVLGFDCIHEGSFARVTYPFHPVNDCLAKRWPYPDLGLFPPSAQPFVHNWQQLADFVATSLNPPQAITADVDTVPIQDLTAYRAKAYALPGDEAPNGVAPAFKVTTHSDNILGYGFPTFTSGTGIADTYYPNGSDGYWLMLKPLPPGKHTIHFAFASTGFSLDVTYQFTVGPSHDHDH